MINKQNIRNLYTAILIVCLFAASLCGGRQMLSAFADERAYTNVLADLQKDDTFNIADYPENARDYSIDIIQIAESASDELLIYTYQPSNNAKSLTASEINMSLSESIDGTKLYTLTLLNIDGVFGKYLVNGVSVSSEFIRYYNITSILRPWNKEIDQETGNDNTKNSVAYAVGKCFRVKTENEEVTYSFKKTDVIEILNPYVDYLEYSNGFKFCPDWCRSHYIAFSTDKQIDTLMEADVSYISRDASRSTGLGLSGNTTYKNEQTIVKPLIGGEKGGNPADGFLGKKYEWERIQRVEDFIASEDLKDETKKNLEGLQWVLRFTETTITMVLGSSATTEFWTDISEVTILRLKFVTAGKLYNLGTVSDKVTGDDTPGNNNTNEYASLWEWLCRITGIPEWAWKWIGVAIVLAIFLPILSAIFPVLGQLLATVLKTIGVGFVWLCKGILWLICLPFKGIAAFIHRIKDRKDGGAG